MPSIKKVFYYFAEPKKYVNLSVPRKIVVGVLSGICFFSIVGTVFTPLIWKGTTNLLTKKVQPAKAPKVVAVASQVIPKSPTPVNSSSQPSEKSVSLPATESAKLVSQEKQIEKPKVKQYEKSKSVSLSYPQAAAKLSQKEQIDEFELAATMKEKFKILEKSGVAIYEEDEEFDPESLNAGDFALKKTNEGVDIHLRQEKDDSLKQISCDYKLDAEDDIAIPLIYIYGLWPFPSGKKPYEKSKAITDKRKDDTEEIAALEAKKLIHPAGAKLRETLGCGKYALIRTANKDEFILAYKSQKGEYFKTKMNTRDHIDVILKYADDLVPVI